MVKEITASAYMYGYAYETPRTINIQLGDALLVRVSS